MRPGQRKTLNRDDPIDALTEGIEKVKASIRAKVEHPFRVIKRQFGYVKTRYRGLAKNAAQVTTLFIAVEPVDGAASFAGGAGMSALAAASRPMKAASKGVQPRASARRIR